MKRLFVEITIDGGDALDHELMTAAQLQFELNLRPHGGIRFSVRELPFFNAAHLEQCNAIIVAMSRMVRDNLKQLSALEKVSPELKKLIRKELAGP